MNERMVFLMTGGYKIIDFQNKNLVTGAESPVTVAGIYSSIENNYRKALMLSGLVIDGVEKANTYSGATAGENNFTFTVYGKTITVSNLDVVTIA